MLRWGVGCRLNKFFVIFIWYKIFIFNRILIVDRIIFSKIYILLLIGCLVEKREDGVEVGFC